MKLFNKIRKAIKSHKKLSAAVTTIAVMAAVPLAVQAGFFPDRPTFDYNNYNGNNNCADTSNPARNNGRCGSLTGPVFDSFVNVPNVGDERYFLDGFRSDQTQAGSHADPVTNVTDGSQEVVLRLYVHNNANSGLNCHADHRDSNGNCTQIDTDAPGIAHNTKVSIALPDNTDTNALRAVGSISADGTTTVKDTFDMTSTKNFKVSYEPGSAMLYNNGAFKNGKQLSDNIVGSGATIGYNALDGIIPGCFDYISTVEIKVKITPTTPPNNHLTLTKQVRAAGTKTWGSEVAAKPGDEVEWLLNTDNAGTTNLTNVVTRDVLPPHVQLDTGSVKFVNAKGSQQLQDDPLFAGGYNAGLYAPNDNTLITFKTKVLGDFDACSTRVRNVAHAKSDQYPDITDDADVIITKENCNNTESPVYSCDLLTATLGVNRSAHFDTKATAINGAQITLYQYNFGDGTAVLTTDKSSVDHTYAKDGQYAVNAKVQIAVNNTLKWVDSAKCATAVSFTTPPTTPPTTPGTPTTLVNTGAGDVAGIFAATTIAGAIGYRLMLGRRLGRQ